MKILREAPIYTTADGAGGDDKLYPLILFELDPETTEVIFNTSSFISYSNYNEAIAFVTSDGAKYDLSDDTLFRHTNKTHTFSEEYGIKWVIVYGTNYYIAESHQNSSTSATKYSINLTDGIPFLQQIKEIVIGNVAIDKFEIGAGSTENSIQSVIFSELHLPVSECRTSKPASQGCFEKMPKLENFDGQGLKGFYFQSAPNYPFRESLKLTHFNIENMENYSGSQVS